MVSDINAAEIRMHMLLNRFRYREEKEFFEVSLSSATDLMNWVCCYIENHEHYCDDIALHSDLIEGEYSKTTTLNESKLIYSTIAFSIGQNISHHLLGYRGDVVSGFASATALSDLFGVKVKSMMCIMRKFCTSCEDLRFVTKNTSEVKIFDQLYYHKGHIAWRYSNAFRPYVQNEKV